MKKADPQRPESWRKYTKGLCDDCWAGCCTMPVEARESDLIRLGLAIEGEAEWSLDDLIARLKKQKLIQAYDPKAKMFILAQVSGRDCVFLDPKSRLCTVYEKRPDTCRNFPRVGSRPGFCPYKPKNGG